VANNCGLKGRIAVAEDIDLAAVQAAIKSRFAHHRIASFGEEDVDALFSGDDLAEEKIGLEDGALVVMVNLRGTAGFESPEATAIAEALDTFAVRPSWLVFTDHETSADTDGAQRCIPVGRTPQDREKACALYGLELAKSYWTYPAMVGIAGQIADRLGKGTIDLLQLPDDAELLRAEAAALLERAQALDGLKPFLAWHSRRNRGDSPHMVWASSNPGHRVDEVLAEEFDPERDALTLLDLTEAGATLSSLTGAHPNTRVRGYGPAAPEPQPVHPTREEMITDLQERLADGALSLEDLTEMVVNAGLQSPGNFLEGMRERFEMAQDDESGAHEAPRSKG
jgi:hypothetical protein